MNHFFLNHGSSGKKVRTTKKNQFREISKQEKELDKTRGYFLDFLYMYDRRYVKSISGPGIQLYYSIGNFLIVQSSSLAPRSVTRKKDMSTVIH